MPQYKTPKREFEFILREVLDVERELKYYKGFEETTWDTIEMIIDQFGSVAEEYWLPSNRDGDEIGVKFENGNVTLPIKMKKAAEKVIESGLLQTQQLDEIENEMKSKVEKSILDSKSADFPTEKDLLTDVYVKY